MITPQRKMNRWLLLPTVFLTTSMISFAQDVTDEEDEIYSLSPFEINTTQDVGYLANNTLAGSRINTRLQDIAASVSVITPEFMDDLGSTDVESTLSFIAGFETNQDFDSSNTTNYVADSTQNSPGGTRVRGLAPADVTADFFLVTNRHFDRYNLDRVAVVRGPNSILFGLGSPSGIINYSMKKALLTKNQNEVGFRFDNFGSMRGHFDFNRIIVEDKLAVRVMGMQDDEKFQFDNTYDDDKRATLAVTYKPTEKTTVRFMYEAWDIDARRPGYNSPIDNITGWVEAGRPTLDPLENPGISTRGQAFSGLVGADRQPAQFFTNANSPDPEYWTMLENARADGTRLPSSQRIRFHRSFDPSHQTTYFADQQVSDTSIFPYDKWDITAHPNSFNKRDGSRHSIVLDQNITDDLNVEFGYYNDMTQFDRLTQIIGQSNSVQIDINERYPNGEANPNFLRPFIFGRGVGRFTEEKNESVRLQFAYSLDLAEKTDVKFLGRHNLSGVYSENRLETFTYAWEPRMANVHDGMTTGLMSTQRRTMGIWYIGPAFTPDMSKPIINNLPNVGRELGQAYDYNYYDAESNSWMTQSGVAMERMLNNNATWNIRNATGYGFALQSYFWDDRLVTTLGWRDDEVSGRSTGFPTPPTNGLYSLDRDDWSLGEPTVLGDQTVTKGLVFHATDWLSLHYNESENFVVSSPAVNLLGEPIPGSSGEGKDYGFTLTLLDSKLWMKVNFYETAQRNSRNGGVAFAAFWRMRGFETNIFNRIEDGTLTGVNWINWDGSTDAYQRFPNVSDANDYEAEGMEIEVMYNPTKNWRIMFNMTSQETIQTNTGAAMLRYIDLRRGQLWNDIWDQSYSSSQTVGEYFNSQVGSRLFPALAANGRVSQSQAKWNWNLVTNYKFSDGRFKGVSAGASMRWTDKRALGYALTTDADGNDITDLDKPFFGPTSLNLGLHCSYGKKIFNDKVDWRIQLNMRNLIGDDELVDSRINPDGSVAAFRIGREKAFILSNTFKF